MYVVSEKIAPLRRPQIFNDYAAEDAATEKREREDHWLSNAVKELAATIRSIVRQPKP